MDFTEKKILITGGTRGIGAAAVQAFLERGAFVAINGRSEESATRAVGDLGGGGRLIPAPGDVGTVAGCEAAVAAAVDRLGGLDILVNSAGVGHGASIEDSDEALWDETLDVNLKGTFFCIKAALPALRRASLGAIVNLASDAGLIGELGLAVYCASKGGGVNMTRAMALDLAPEIRVNCVCPGYVDTDMVRRDGIEKARDPVRRRTESGELRAPEAHGDARGDRHGHRLSGLARGALRHRNRPGHRRRQQRRAVSCWLSAGRRGRSRA